MRVENWGYNEFDGLVESATNEKLMECAEIIKANVSQKCPVGTISHPMYRRGKYANQNWTSRDAGRLIKSIRIVKNKQTGRLIWKKRDIRVYAGHYMAWYASIVEYYTPFMRAGLASSIPAMREILTGKL